jgi:hypothetical protein
LAFWPFGRSAIHPVIVSSIDQAMISYRKPNSANSNEETILSIE